jgi:hypothetical protein
MGLFSFLGLRKKASAELDGDPEIPKEKFVDESDPTNDSLDVMDANKVGLELIYDFLQYDYEGRGYGDALTNPDDSYRRDNIKLIRLDLEILIDKVYSYYKDHEKELDFHIRSRERAGLVDVVELIKSRKETLLDHMAKVESIRQDMINEQGVMSRLHLSYSRGFMRGLSAITRSEILKKPI